MSRSQEAIEGQSLAEKKAEEIAARILEDLAAGRINLQVLYHLQFLASTQWMSRIAREAPAMTVWENLQEGEVRMTCPHCGEGDDFAKAVRVENTVVRWTEPYEIREGGYVQVDLEARAYSEGSATVILCAACEQVVTFPDGYTVDASWGVTAPAIAGLGFEEDRA